jgi:hypothetical protein
MARRVIVHDGDYTLGEAWLCPAGTHGFSGFTVRNYNGRTRRIPLRNVGAAEPATPAWIRTVGGDETMVETFRHLSDEQRAGAFVVLFRDGTLMLASTDPETCARLCAGRGARPID